MAGLSELSKIYLKRSGVVFSKDKAQGLRGTLKIGEVSLETIERADGHLKLPNGEFLMTSYTDPDRGKVLGVQNTGKYGHNVPKWRDGKIVGTAGIMIHAADTPDDLTGCMAPGRSFDSSTNTLLKSSEAMSDIFTYLGGFGETKLIGWIVVE
jgi:hypothetical protein